MKIMREGKIVDNKKIKNAFILIGAVLIVFLIIIWQSQAGVPSTVLSAKKITGKITIDGVANEPEWNTARAITFDTKYGIGATKGVVMKALYDDANAYLLAVWKDETSTESVWEGPGWIYNKAKKSFSLIGNANPEVYEEAEEDRFAIQWEIGKVGDFGREGCTAICHPLGGHKVGMRTNAPGEKTDEWHWKAGRSNPVGILHDKYIDDKYDPKDVEIAHGSDSAGWYDRNRNKEKTGPVYFKLGATGEDAIFITQAEIKSGKAIPVAGNEDKLVDGQKIPGRILDESRIEGKDVGDVKAKGTFSKGIWTLEMKRALNTKFPNDAAFDIANKYNFGVAIFDDSGHEPQHSFAVEVFTLEFER